MRICTGCLITKPLEDFAKLSKREDGRSTRCKRCRADYMKAYYKANPQPIKNRTAKYFDQNRQELNLKRKIFRQNHLERELQTGKKWAKNNPEKMKQAKAKSRAKRNKAVTFVLAPKDLKKLLLSPCFYCGQPSEHWDHVVPLAKGGTHGIGNLVPACSKCNLQKNSKTIMEWKLWKLRVLGC